MKPLNVVTLLNIIDEKTDYVVFLHGITKDYNTMRNLERAFRLEGYNTFLISYPSTLFNVKDLSAMVSLEINKNIIFKNFKKGQKIHYVAHSMGGLLVRTMLEDISMRSNLGNVVMIATPNFGSILANIIKRIGLMNSILGPAGNDIMLNNLYKNISVSYNLGIIAGSKMGKHFIAYFLISGINDGRVGLESTKLSGYKDFRLFKDNHDNLPDNSEVIKNSINFIKYSKFI